MIQLISCNSKIIFCSLKIIFCSLTQIRSRNYNIILVAVTTDQLTTDIAVCMRLIVSLAFFSCFNVLVQGLA